MIILQKPSGYCANAIQYAAEKEKARIVKVNHMPENLSAVSMWHRMKIHCMKYQARHTQGRPMKYPMLTFVISPSPGECAGWDMKDWARLYDEVMEAFDTADMSEVKGCGHCVPVNFRNSMSVAALHSDSKSGKLHMHADICHIDMDGNTNQLHMLHERARMAADIVNRNRGWVLPEDIRKDKAQEVADDCIGILRDMPKFEMSTYFYQLRRKGYEVETRKSEGKVVGYTIKAGASIFKASELGRGRRLTASRLKSAWYKLHKDDSRQNQAARPHAVAERNAAMQATPVEKTRPDVPKAVENSVKNRPETVEATVAKPVPKYTTYNITVDGKDYECRIPDAVRDIFHNEAELPDDVLWSSVEDVMHTAMLLFCGYAEAATSMSVSLGGGGGNAAGWGKKDDEEDWKFARRCLATARTMHQRPSRAVHR